MAEINEQRELANEVADAISNTANLGLDIDEVRVRLHSTATPYLTSILGRAGRGAGRARAGAVGRALGWRRARSAAPTARRSEGAGACVCNHYPTRSIPDSHPTAAKAAVEDDEEAQLRELQASMAI